jgi:hypothetical protein
MTIIPQELKDLIIKIIIPSLVAISIKLALETRKGKVSVFNAIMSVIIGVGCAYLSSGYVMNSFNESHIPIVIACITIVGEKIAYWLIYKFSFDVIGDALIEIIVNKFKNKK